jgi:glycerol-3-phosphate dehydrogenase (NAD(P)+)
VAEGAKSCSSLRALAERTGIEAPIVENVDEVVAGRMSTSELMHSFISRDPKAEIG